MVVEVAEQLRYTMEALCRRVHKLRKHYRQVHSSIGLYSPSWTYIHLGSFPQAADLDMTGLCSPSWTYMN